MYIFNLFFSNINKIANVSGSRFCDIHDGGCNQEYLVGFLQFDLYLDNLLNVKCESLPYAIKLLYFLSKCLPKKTTKKTYATICVILDNDDTL
jgi:hypothetical protein